ncbi:plasma kallikrein-like [Episyrphus balteatus]|uniref:plasma kallikrein-like n=1 Tax=Episyrphus balteatus TaxID=286459 RepID=UPI00248598E7|nr:plasma kallikrein-like [Episyrphus balteatus]
MLNGIPADTIKKIPHFVSIQPFFSNGDGTKLEPCVGSIIADQWVLTSADCVSQGNRLQLDFEKFHKNSTAKSYGAVVNNDEDWVHVYPTYYDNIAMVKVPFQLKFSNSLKPIRVSSKQPSEMLKKLAILPGYDGKKDELSYAMMSITSNDDCIKAHGNYDEYLNICSKPYMNNGISPCLGESGSGLVTGWPKEPEIVGIFTAESYDCYSYKPSVYVNIVKYITWIESIIGSINRETYTTTSGPLYT